MARVLLLPVFFPLRDFFAGKDSCLGAYFFVPVAKKFGVMMPFSLLGNGFEIALYPRLVTRKNFDQIPKTNYFGICKIAVSDQLFNSDANLVTVRFRNRCENRGHKTPA